MIIIDIDECKIGISLYMYFFSTMWNICSSLCDNLSNVAKRKRTTKQNADGTPNEILTDSVIAAYISFSNDVIFQIFPKIHVPFLFSYHRAFCHSFILSSNLIFIYSVCRFPSIAAQLHDQNIIIGAYIYYEDEIQYIFLLSAMVLSCPHRISLLRIGGCACVCALVLFFLLISL